MPLSNLQHWRDALWTTYARLECASDDALFYGHVAEQISGSHTLSVVTSTSQKTERTAQNIRKDPQEFVLCAFQIEGSGFAEQEGRRSTTTSMQFVIYDTTRPYTLFFAGPFQQMVIKLPRPLLDRRIANLPSLTGRTFDAGQGAGAVAREFLESLNRRGGEINAERMVDYMSVAADLVANAIDLQTVDVTNSRTRFERLSVDLRRMAREPVDLEAFARIHCLSMRTMQRLFQAHGTTPGRVLLETRLEGVMQDLRSAACRGRPIGDIALSWGFNDLSYFARAFRSRFGATAVEARNFDPLLYRNVGEHPVTAALRRR